MNLASLKKIYDKLPYAVKAPFAKRLRNQLLNNPTFKEEYQFFESGNHGSFKA